MPDPIFSHPRLARVYDAFDSDRADLDAYVRIAEELEAKSVVDVGCGTGLLAVRLARLGLRVTGVDPAVASLDVARGRPDAGLVTWVEADAASVPPLGADLAVMTGNVAQVFLDDGQWQEALLRLAQAVRVGGWLVFETRRPEDRAWERWGAETAPVVREVAGEGLVERRLQLTAVSLPLVSFRYTYRFLSDGATLASDSTLRFRGRSELERDLAAAGFSSEDVREAPDRLGRELVVVARRLPDLPARDRRPPS